jgi:hypothetical protein
MEQGLMLGLRLESQSQLLVALVHPVDARCSSQVPPKAENFGFVLAAPSDLVALKHRHVPNERQYR